MPPDTESLQAIRDSLQAVRDTLLETKYAFKNITDRVDDLRSDVDANSQAISAISNTSVRNEEQLAVIRENYELMRSSVRSIQNAVIGALIISLLMGIGNLAFNSIKVGSDPVRVQSK